MELEIHPIQANILRVLLFKPEAKFSEMNALVSETSKGRPKISSDHFNFHIKRLSELGLVEKTGKHSYGLTRRGKEFSNRLDTEKVSLERQAKIAVLVIPVRTKKKSKYYLTQQRLKQPYYGFHGFISGKVKWGETLSAAAERELKEEAGLKARLRPVGIEHKTDYSTDKQLLEDKYFFVFRAENPQGQTVENFEGGRNFWLTRKEITKLPNLFDDVMQLLELAEQKRFRLVENKFTVKSY